VAENVFALEQENRLPGNGIPEVTDRETHFIASF
jgi:hypothetical protein